MKVNLFWSNISKSDWFVGPLWQSTFARNIEFQQIGPLKCRDANTLALRSYIERLIILV